MQESSYGSARLYLVEIADCHEGALWTQRLKVNYDQGKQGQAREVGGTSIFNTDISPYPITENVMFRRRGHLPQVSL